MLVQDNFQRSNQSGWGVASDGNRWSAGAGLSIVSNHGAISYSGSSQFESLGTATAADAEAVVRFSIKASNETAGIVMRWQANGSMYLARYNGNGGLDLKYRTGAGTTTLGVVAFTVNPGASYWMRFRLSGSQAMFKAWPNGQVEPAAWNWSGGGATNTAPGVTGLYGWAGGTASVLLDSFSATAVGGSPAPSPSPSPMPGSAPGGGLFLTSQARSGVINGPPNGQVETDVNWLRPSDGNGWQVGVVPGYGGANVSFWSEIDAGKVGSTQTTLNTTTPSGFMHDFTNRGDAFTGSEDYPFTTVENRPPGVLVWVSFNSVAPSSGTDSNGLVHRVTTFIYPGDPGLLVQRFDLTNTSSQPVALSDWDSLELVLIGGLEQADSTWQPRNGVYGMTAGKTGPWPATLTAGSPDYYFITPRSGSPVHLGVEAIRKAGLQTSGATNLQFEYQQNDHRLKIGERGHLGSIPGKATLTFYALQVLARDLNPVEAKSIASDYLHPDSPKVSGGSFTAFSYNDGAYHFSSSSGTSLQFTMAMEPVDSTRWLTEFAVTNWTSTKPPVVKVAGMSLVAGSDYVTTVDPTTHTTYVKLLRRLSSVPGAPNTIFNGTISMT